MRFCSKKGSKDLRGGSITLSTSLRGFFVYCSFFTLCMERMFSDNGVLRWCTHSCYWQLESGELSRFM